MIDKIVKYVKYFFTAKSKEIEKETVVEDCGNFTDTITLRYGKIHSFDDLPSKVRACKSGFVIMQQWHKDGVLHRDSGEAVKICHRDGKNFMYLAFTNGVASSNEKFETLGVVKSGNTRLTYKSKVVTSEQKK